MSPVYLVAAPTGSPLLGFYIDAEAGHPALPEDAPDARETLDRLLALSDEPLTVYRCRRNRSWWVVVP